jgi:hypothetical protein
MQIASLMVILLWMAGAGFSGSTLTGLWVLSHDKSNFGAAFAQQGMVLRIDPSDQGLTVLEITSDLRERHVAYRHVSLDGRDCQLREFHLTAGATCWVQPTSGETIDEKWAISDSGELIVERLVKMGARVIHQRLVLEPSRALE